MKYPIKSEFFPFSLFRPPLNKVMLKFANTVLTPSLWLHEDESTAVRRFKTDGHAGEKIDLFLIEPKGLEKASPCLIYIHGGGFVMDAAPSHYALAKIYAKEVGCRVVFVRYHLAPKYPFPAAPEDCFAALQWVLENAQMLGVDKNRIAVGGDSAGGALAAALSLMARDRLSLKLSFQLLIYPVADCRMNTESNKKFTNTPMWNSRLSKRMWQMYLPEMPDGNIEYASPAEAQSLEGLPPAYVETAQFDCLRDEGIEYAQRLGSSGVETLLVQTEGTMHGFDVKLGTPTAKECIKKRVEFMRSRFEQF